MALIVVTPPSGGLIALADAKAQARVLHDEDDDLFLALILAASGTVEGLTQRRYLTQTLNWVRHVWDDPMVLPVAGPTDCQSLAINSVSYVDLSTGDTLVLDPSQYWVRPAGYTLSVVRRWFIIYPWLGDGAERVVINFTIAGDLTTVPPEAAHATKLLVSHWYQNRDAVVGVEGRDSSTPVPLGVEQLLTGLRWND
jgi:uncharacterized phiE125 gp8 family phage protein